MTRNATWNRRRWLAGGAALLSPFSARAGDRVLDDLRARIGLDYRLREIRLDDEIKPMPEQPPITLKIHSEWVLGGRAAINRYFGSFTPEEDGRVTWPKGGLATTLMAGPQEWMELEEAYLRSLVATDRVRAEGDVLLFESEDGVLRLVFHRAV